MLPEKNKLFFLCYECLFVYVFQYVKVRGILVQTTNSRQINSTYTISVLLLEYIEIKVKVKKMRKTVVSQRNRGERPGKVITEAQGGARRCRIARGTPELDPLNGINHFEKADLVIVSFLEVITIFAVFDHPDVCSVCVFLTMKPSHSLIVLKGWYLTTKSCFSDRLVPSGP